MEASAKRLFSTNERLAAVFKDGLEYLDVRGGGFRCAVRGKLRGPLVDETLAPTKKLLAISSLTHVVFGKDPFAHGIRQNVEAWYNASTHRAVVCKTRRFGYPFELGGFPLESMNNIAPLQSRSDHARLAEIEDEILTIMRRLPSNDYWLPFVFVALMLPNTNRSAACAFAMFSPVFEKLREWESLTPGPAKVVRDFFDGVSVRSGCADDVAAFEDDPESIFRSIHLFGGTAISGRNALKRRRGPYLRGHHEERELHAALARRLQIDPGGSTTIVHESRAFNVLYEECVSKAVPKLVLGVMNGASLMEARNVDVTGVDSAKTHVFVGVAAMTDSYMHNARIAVLGDERNATGGWLMQDVKSPVVRNSDGQCHQAKTSLCVISMRMPDEEMFRVIIFCAKRLKWPPAQQRHSAPAQQ